MVMMLVQVDLLVVFDGRNGPPMTCCTKNRAFKLSGCRTAGHCGILRDHGGASAAECGGSSLAFKMPFFFGIEIG